MKRPRVLHVIKSLQRGGAEVLLTETLRHGHGLAFDADVVSLQSADETLSSRLGEADVALTTLGAKSHAGVLASVARLRGLARRHRPDVIHAHLPLAGVVARVVGRDLGIPVVYTEHNLFSHYHPLTRALALSTWPLQRAVIAVSHEVRDEAVAAAGAAVPVRVIENAVDTQRFARDAEAGAAVRARLGIDADAPVVGTVAVFRPAKRFDRWLAVAADVHRRHPHVRFVIVGWGPLRSEVEEAVDAHGLRDVVTLAGPQSDVRPFLSALDVYFMSSDFEGLPVALLEAMATGLSAVSTSAGGIPGVVRAGVDGWLHDGTEESVLRQSLATSLSLAVADRVERQRRGEHARARVEEKFGMRRLVDELSSLYAEVAWNS